MSAKNDIILANAKAFFNDVIAQNHLKNLAKLGSLKEFHYNPFLLKYLAFFLCGEVTAESISKALIYPRILGTSITTSFGENIQRFCSQVLPGYGSAIKGIDIEFEDKIDKRKKYCQIKAGSQTINKDDIDTIKNHFSTAKRTARTNNLNINTDDLVVGVLYGTEEELSDHYRKVQEEYPVYVGQEFWARLTGNKNLYNELIQLFGEISKENHTTELLNKTIQQLAQEVQEKIIDQIP